jgi:hypothetical protein
MQAVMQTIARMHVPGPCPDCRLDPCPCEPSAVGPAFCPREDAEAIRRDRVETKEERQ